MKKQLKKSLSLFLAVLMVLSCWVWVAPQKASADNDNTTGQYYVKAKVYVDTYCDAAYGNFYLSWTTNNGTGSNTSLTKVKTLSAGTFGSGVDDTTITLYEGYIDGFPYQAATDMVVPSDLAGRELDIDRLAVYVGADKDSCTNLVLGGSDSDSYECKSGWSDASWSTSDFTINRVGTLPYINSAESMGTTTLDCPAVGTALKEGNKTTPVKPVYWDQYGVKWIATVDPTYYISKTENGSELDNTDESHGFWTAKSDTSGYVNINSAMQENFLPEDDGKNEYYMVATINNGSTDVKVSQKITVSFSPVTFIFDADGSISGLNSIIKDAGGNVLSTSKFEPSDYYGQSGTFPTNESVTAGTGYTFYGFWTVKQPTSGDASFNALAAKFAEPCSSTDYATYKAMTGATESNGVVTVVVDGIEKRYYDAGENWDTSIKTFDGNREPYYGWWLSDDLSVKFYDIDGSYFGEQTVKYGQTQSVVTWPTSKYVDTGYTSGAFTFKIDNNKWINYDGEEVIKSGYTFTHDLLLTPGLSGSSFADKYNIAFVDQNLDNNGQITNIGELGGTTYTKKYGYRETIAFPATRDVPDEISTDLQYSYEFLGWSTVAPANGRYHVLLEDADFDVNGRAVGINSDWIVRNDAIYYAVYRRHTRTYAVNFWYYDATATYVSRRVTVKYGDRLTPPTDYVPYNYATGGYGYTFANWNYTDGNNNKATLGYSDSIFFTSDYISIAFGAVVGSGGAVTIQASYGAGVPTPYTVTFLYRDAKGEVQTLEAEVNHGETITQETIDKLVTAKEYDNGEALVTYMGRWTVVEGAAEAEVYETNALTSFSPTSHITFEAEYGNPKNFYTVTYVDGTNSYNERVLTGENLPEWTYKSVNDNGTPDDETDDDEVDKVYVPSMADDEKGSYEFQGWFDEKQTDTTYNATNGKKYTTADKVSGNLTLYPQFKYRPFTYTIKFMNYDGSVQLAAGEYEYGQNFASIFAIAQKAAQYRDADETYEYTFIGWDQPYNEDNLICEGKDVTFTALYKASYRYYNAKWYNSKLVDGKWVADKTTEVVDEETVEKYLLATTHHTYNSKVYTPSVSTICNVTAPSGQDYVFAGWYYNDANGNAVKYTRGMLITSEMEFYATYILTTKKLTVTTVVDEKTTEYTVASGEKATVPDPVAGFVDENAHRGFAGWYTTATCTCTAADAEGVTECTCVEVDFDSTPITENITVYARFEVSAHVYDNMLDKEAPTYYKAGTRQIWCSCDSTRTLTTQAIPMLTDNVAPTGTIYLGALGKWSSTGDPAYNTDNDPVTLYANAKTDIIINTNDTGLCNDNSEEHNATTCVNCLYNPTGIGKGVKTIKAFAFPGETALTAENYGAAQEVAITVYEDTSEILTNTANYTVKLGDLVVADLDENGDVQYEVDENGEQIIKTTPLKDGEIYIIYYYVTDKAGNMLNRKVRTAKFYYDTTAPTFTVEGEGDGTNVYCEEATIKVVESDTTLTVNGESKAYTTTAANGSATYTIEEAGNYLVKVTDKAGNSTSKKIRIAEHDYATKQADATCTVDGYVKTVCLTCGDVKESTTETAIGHVYGMLEVTEATCLENGWTVTTCENCGHTVKTVTDENGDYILPALGHEYPLNYEWVTVADGNYNYVYTTVTDEETGEETKAIITKTEGEGEDAVTYYQISTVAYTTVIAPTCMTKGKEVTSCTVCGEAELIRYTDIDADAHKLGTLKTLQPTCTDAGYSYRVCKLCSKHVKEDGSDVAATGHTVCEWVVTKEATCAEEGVETLKCTVCTQFADSDDEDAEIDTREIAKTENHNYDFVKTETEDGVDYAVYKCSVCGAENKVEVKAEEVVKYTVTFINEDGTVISSTEKVVGETIAAVDAPAKTDKNGVYKYTFVSWAKAVKANDGSYTAGETVKLPLEVTEDITLIPVYTGTKIIYTHQFITYNTYAQATSTIAEGEEETETETIWEFTDKAVFETMMNVIGGTAVPSKTPTIKETEFFTFEFQGWANASGVMVDDFTVTYDETTGKADRTFYAVFKATPKTYKVVYYANGTEYVWDTKVKGGESVTFGGTEPTKDYDGTYHYTFSKWYLDATLTTEYTNQPITSDTKLYASFTATEHVHDEGEGKGTVIQKATCVLTEVTKYECTCGHSITKTTGEALGHKAKDAVQETIDGVAYSVVYCERCDAVISKTATTVTVTFDYNNNATTALTKTFNVGDVITYTGADPVKASDTSYTYTFEGWYLSGDETQTVVDFAKGEIKASEDVTYVAKYKETERKYNITYVDVKHNTLINHSLAYGAEIPAYEGTAPTKVHDAKNHYVFAGWSVEEGTTVTGDLMITPVFTTVAHKYEQAISSPSCVQAGGITYTCSCGYSYTDSLNSVPATGHSWSVTTVPATYESDGLETKVCTTCGETETTVLPKLEYRTVSVTVKDSNGNTIKGAKVELYKDGEWIEANFSDSNGKVTFTVKDEGKYTVIVSGVEDASVISYDINVSGEGYNDNGNPSKTVSITSCTCSCHRDGFWGTIFRMFHKLIKLFTGAIKCCSCPDSRY